MELGLNCPNFHFWKSQIVRSMKLSELWNSFKMTDLFCEIDRSGFKMSELPFKLSDLLVQIDRSWRNCPIFFGPNCPVWMKLSEHLPKSQKLSDPRPKCPIFLENCPIFFHVIVEFFDSFIYQVTDNQNNFSYYIYHQEVDASVKKCSLRPLVAEIRP